MFVEIPATRSEPSWHGFLATPSESFLRRWFRELPVRPVLTHLHQQLKLPQLNLLFEETEASLLPHVQRLVDRVARFQKIGSRTRFDVLQRPQPIANVVVVGQLVGATLCNATLRSARVGHAVEFLKQPEPLHFVAAPRFLERSEFREELRELCVVETKKFLPLNNSVAVEQLLHFAWR